MRDALSEAIRNIILPRLVAAGRVRDLGLAHAGSSITDNDIATMIAHVLTPDHSVAEAMLTLLKLRGASRIEVLTRLFLVVESRLQHLRRQGQCSQTDVTLAIGRLRLLVQSKALPFHDPISPDARKAPVLIVSLGDEIASLETTILVDTFRGAGWDTHLWAGTDAALIPRGHSGGIFGVIMITVPKGPASAMGGDIASKLRRSCTTPIVEVAAGTLRTSDTNGRLVIQDIGEAVATAEKLVGQSG